MLEASGGHRWLLRCLTDTTEFVGVAPRKGTLLVSYRKYLYSYQGGSDVVGVILR